MDVDREIIELLVDDDDDTVVDTNDLGDRVVVDLTDDVEDEPPNPPPIATNFRHDQPCRGAVHNLLSTTERHHAPQLPFVELEKWQHNGIRLKVGDFLELKPARGPTKHDRISDFLHVHYILRNVASNEIMLRGLKLKRTFKAGTLPKKVNELYLEIRVCEDNDYSPYEQNLVDVPVDQTVKKRKVNVTNSQHPHATFRDDPIPWPIDRDHPEALMTAVRSFELGCRWISISYYRNTRDMRDNRSRLTVLRMFREDEVDPAYAVSEAEQQEHSTPFQYLREQHRQTGRYTIIDAFCGAGGISVGARQAGLKPTHAFDLDAAAIRTYELNQDEMHVYTLDVYDFIEYARRNDLTCDVLHISPPCLAWSRANRQGGQNYEANQALIKCIDSLVKVLRPRLVTLEEAEWLVRYHRAWWRGVVKDLTDLHYSTTWKILNCCNYDDPQNRERVILFASAPGMLLPEVPAATHGPAGSGLRPFVTIRDALAKLARHSEASHNSTRGPLAPKARTNQPYNADRLAWCITTGGSDGREGTYHPSGTRDFTLRELAMLQGFPPNFAFANGLNKTQVRKQIGNAVPPPLAKAIFRACREALESADAAV